MFQNFSGASNNQDPTSNWFEYHSIALEVLDIDVLWHLSVPDEGQCLKVFLLSFRILWHLVMTLFPIEFKHWWAIKFLFPRITRFPGCDQTQWIFSRASNKFLSRWRSDHLDFSSVIDHYSPHIDVLKKLIYGNTYQLDPHCLSQQGKQSSCKFTNRNLEAGIKSFPTIIRSFKRR